MRGEFEKHFRAEHKLNAGKSARFPKITHPYWAKVVYLKRFKTFPVAGGLEDQSFKFIKYLNLVTETESLISQEQARKNKTKKP
jgi:hypothetical protein